MDSRSNTDMIEKKTDIVLRALSSSPFSPQPAERSLLVNLFMRLAILTGKAGHVTPHLFKGADSAKVEWEYGHANAFFESLSNYVTIGILDGKDVLDVGCGWGGKMIYFAEHSRLRSIHGFDLPGAYLPEVSAKFAKGKNVANCFFGTGYAEHIPFDDNRFDVIIMEDVLEHVDDPQTVLLECYRVLRKGGTAIIKFPSFKSMYGHHLDRALIFPALHYILPMETWASGLNYLRLQSGSGLAYEPFDEIVSTKYCSSITHNLNGLDFDGFRDIVGKNNLRTRVMELIPHARDARKSPLKVVYRFLFKFAFLKEFLSDFTLYVGEKNE
jgi:ubiquinone/menaquinone biosynthesis C-methylase UbiE